ncbi:MAG: phosphoglucosamine mutase [Chlorobi bacterium]|nr:phosphoglucosamine mutase [Chlorobiota bacterium]
MPLISSVSGIRGTIGGLPGEGLTPVDIVAYAAAYGKFILNKARTKPCRIVVGRDARISGEQVCEFVCNTLIAMGIDTVELGLSTTPTVEMAVIAEQASGGIIITASHNPEHWNALKLLNEKGEFLSGEEGAIIRDYRNNGDFRFASIQDTGIRTVKYDYLEYHIDKIMALEEVDSEAIKKAGFSIVVDGINSVGGIAVPALLQKLGVRKIKIINGEPTGRFAHNPEPLPEHLQDLTHGVLTNRADIGIVVDPDVDRLAFICENGKPFGEEYTLVAVADYLLQKKSGNVVSNLSSSNALGIVAQKYGGKRYTSAVGEVHVVQKMKETNAVIGGEGNGGIIYPPLHYGRDALVGIALFLTYLAKLKEPVSKVRQKYPDLFIAKSKISIPGTIQTEELFSRIVTAFPGAVADYTDGLYLALQKKWIHIRKSNTEPVLRIYSEADSPDAAEMLAKSVKKIIE